VDANLWREAKPILAEALQRPPKDREALLNARCADPDLRRELQAYLTEYDERFLETVLTVSDTLQSSGSAAGEGAQAPDIRNGDRIGPYVIVDSLGAGGMGRVFLADDTRLHRKVAVKCLTAWTTAGELRSRVLHEARSAARITHPNIAIVYDVLEHDGQPLLIMEYVEGESLAAVIKRGRPSVETIVAMTRQLASALAAAHAKGIVHRDLKPANIQVTPAGSPKILDFGVAHAMSAASTGVTMAAAGLTVPMNTNTLQGDRRVMHPGTPAYMSPEQMFGRPIDQRSDIYSLGVIVYEMATGHRPYATDDPLEVVLTLSRNFLSPGEAPAPVPAQLSGVITRMLAVRPDDRFQTAGELENALVTLTAPAAADPGTALVRSPWRTVARAAAAALVAVAAVTLLGVMETGTFNRTLGRSAPFDHEPAAVWLEMGLRGLVVPAVYSAVIFVAFAALRFTVRIVSLSPGVEHLLTTGATRTMRLSEKLGLDDPAVMSQAVAGLGIVLMGALFWRYWPFIHTWAAIDSIGRLPAESYAPLRPGQGQARLDAQTYRIAFSAVIVLFTVAMTHILRRRSRSPVPTSNAGLAVVGAMLLVAILMCQAPYRVVWKNEMPLLDVAGERCFALGQSGDDLLIHCPDRLPPRNRTVKRSDPAVHDTGLRQNIFAPPGDVSTHER
jgi:hypothetical protein